MDYAEFCRITKTELPLNRKERFYTGTVLPALLFHNGYDVFFDFLGQLTGFPSEINQHTTGDGDLFYTEYNLRESGGSRSVGAVIDTTSNETPDAIIEILRPKKRLSVCRRFACWIVGIGALLARLRAFGIPEPLLLWV